jgi:hypothetical protein
MRTFSLEEAQWHLPILEGLLKTAMEGKQVIEAVEEDISDASHAITFSGGMIPDIVHLSRRRAERDKAVQHTKDALAEIEAMGVQVKDLDMGLLDFPCKVDEDIVLLCWKVGEDKITHWHGMEEGFRGRKPITDEIRRGTRNTAN